MQRNPCCCAGASESSKLKGTTALHVASAGLHLDVVKALVGAGASVRCVSAAGALPHHLAASSTASHNYKHRCAL